MVKSPTSLIPPGVAVGVYSILEMGETGLASRRQKPSDALLISTLVILPDDDVAAGAMNSGTPLIWDNVRRIFRHSLMVTVLTCAGRSTPSGTVNIVVEILTLSSPCDNGESETKIVDNRMIAFIFAERRAHVPLVAAAEVAHEVKVVITGNHLNRTATSGYVARLVVLPVS